MKKRIKFFREGLLCCLLLGGLAGGVQLHAQTEPKAKLDKVTKLISLDETAPLGYQYQLNFADMNFATKEKAEEFFGAYSNEMLSFALDFDKRSAMLTLNMRAHPRWSVKDWNTYLAGIAKK